MCIHLFLCIKKAHRLGVGELSIRVEEHMQEKL